MKLKLRHIEIKSCYTHYRGYFLNYSQCFICVASLFPHHTIYGFHNRRPLYSYLCHPEPIRSTVHIHIGRMDSGRRFYFSLAICRAVLHYLQHKRIDRFIICYQCAIESGPNGRQKIANISLGNNNNKSSLQIDLLCC